MKPELTGIKLIHARHFRCGKFGLQMFVLLGLVFAAGLARGANQAVSTEDVVVDTLDRGWGELTVSLHRVPTEALENTGPDVGIDDPLVLKAGARQILLNHTANEESLLGLIADGVTPLLIRVQANDVLTEPVTYAVDLKPYWAYRNNITFDLATRLSVYGDLMSRETLEFTLTADEPVAFLVLAPIDTTEFNTDNRKLLINLSLERKYSAWYRFWGTIDKAIEIRVPPVALVHGYNVSDSEWGPSFVYGLQNEWSSLSGREVIPIGYGINGNTDNSYANLDVLLDELDKELEKQVENKQTSSSSWTESHRWAWTRYDVVGHSQGGLLLRLLCSLNDSELPHKSASVFRKSSNYHRGRFRRVITIGSPHYGSTLAHLARKLHDRELPFDNRSFLLSRVVNRDYWFNALGKFIDVKKEKLLQRKFMIDEGSPGYPTPKKLHQRFAPDPNAKIHLIGTTIYKGETNTGVSEPRVYELLYFSYNDGQGGRALAPRGSDGVVDLRSQLARTDIALGEELIHATRIDASRNISHSPPTIVFGTDDRQTSDGHLGEIVRELLDGPASAFGPFPTYEESSALYDELHDVATNIEEIVDHVAATTSEMPQGQLIDSSANIASAGEYSLAEGVHVASGSTSLSFSLTPVPTEPQAEPAGWSAVVYGEDGVTTNGLSLTLSGSMNENLQLDVASNVLGEVVVSVAYVSTNGNRVISKPAVAWSRFPSALETIAFDPPSIRHAAGPTIETEIWGEYASGHRLQRYTDQTNMSYTSSDDLVASVDTRGRITLHAPGQAFITGSYDGMHSATVDVQVAQPMPQISSSGQVQANLGELFSYTITSDPAASTYSASGLPFTYGVEPVTGVVTGVPLSEGIFLFEVEATNAEGAQGRQTVQLTVTGTNVAPEAVGLDVESVPALQPIGSLVGELHASDSNVLDSHSYALVAGIGDVHNTLFTVSSNRLLTAASIDPAVTPECSLRVRATDSGGLTVESVLVLPVLGAPVITDHPRSRTVFSGHTFGMAAVANGRAPLLFQWQENGTNLLGQTGRSLTLTAGSPTTNTYQVVVSNALGIATSSAATVVVEPRSFGAWASKYAEPGKPAVIPSGDIDGDGVANWYSYAFGANATNMPQAMPRLIQTNGSLLFIYQKGLNIAPLNYQIRMRESLQQGFWETYTFEPGMETVTPVDEQREQVEVTVPVTNQYFYKLEVQE